jgi:Tol biopolymer transport system component
MTRRTLLALAATIVAVLLAGCGGTPQDGSGSQNGSNRQGRSEAANANSVGRCAGNVSTRQQEGRGEDSNDTQIAFTRVIAGEPTASGPYATESELYVMNADGSNETRLTNTPESYAKILATSPDWSPDGNRIAYLKGIDVDTGRTDRDIYVINADGSNPSSLTTVEQSTIAWSPDGTKIAFDGWTRSGDINGRPGIYLLNPDGTGQEYLTGGTSFSWSPDSKKIAFVIQSSTSDSSASASDEDSDIYIRRTDGSDLTRLTNTPDIDESTPDWSPDGTKIVFTSTSLTGNNDIYVMNSDGSGRTNLTNTKRSEDHVTWSPARVGTITERTQEAIACAEAHIWATARYKQGTARSLIPPFRKASGRGYRGIKWSERQSWGRYAGFLQPYRRARRPGPTTILAPFPADFAQPP